MRIIDTYRKAPPDAEAALRRGYAIQTRVLGPVDSLEAHAGVIGGDVESVHAGTAPRSRSSAARRAARPRRSAPAAAHLWAGRPVLRRQRRGRLQPDHHGLALPVIGFAAGWL